MSPTLVVTWWCAFIVWCVWQVIPTRRDKHSPERRDWEAKPRCDMHYTVYVRGPERYILVFTTDHSREAINKVAQWAADPELAFSFADANRVYDSINASVEEVVEA